MFNFNRAFEIPDDGLILENGVHIVSGVNSPQGIINAVNPTYYIQTNGVLWFNSGTGSNTWEMQTKVTFTEVEIISEVPFNVLDYNDLVELDVTEGNLYKITLSESVQ